MGKVVYDITAARALGCTSFMDVFCTSDLMAVLCLINTYRATDAERVEMKEEKGKGWFNTETRT